MTAKEKRRSRSSGPRVEGGGQRARKIAMVILEVLGGHRTPTAAARELGVSTTRYYGLEKQGLEALVTACERRSPGRRHTPDKQIAALERKVAQLEKECARRQALIRLSQRALGIRQPPKPKKKSNGRMPKRATVRALKAAEQLDAGTDPSEDVRG